MRKAQAAGLFAELVLQVQGWLLEVVVPCLRWKEGEVRHYINTMYLNLASIPILQLQDGETGTRSASKRKAQAFQALDRAGGQKVLILPQNVF